MITTGGSGGVMAIDPYLDRIEAKGKKEGFIEGEKRAWLLMEKLFAEKRVDDVKKAAFDEAFRKGLYKEFGIE